MEEIEREERIICNFLEQCNWRLEIGDCTFRIANSSDLRSMSKALHFAYRDAGDLCRSFSMVVIYMQGGDKYMTRPHL
jgi:hypothetical protein